MQVYISIDMEGIAGIATLDQVIRGGHGYPRAQELMTAEANAAIAGAFDGGATKVVINDSHGTMDNLILDQLDPRAEVILGFPKVRCMAEGMSPEDDVALFVGYHAPAGDPGVLSHTFSAHFSDLRVGGQRFSEAEVNAMTAAEVSVPIGMVTGDDVICDIAERAFPGVIPVKVKSSHGWTATRTLSPRDSRAAIRAAAKDAVKRAASFSPLILPESFLLEVDLPNQIAADFVQLIPGVSRKNQFTISAELANPDDLIGLIMIVSEVTSSAMRRVSVVADRR